MPAPKSRKWLWFYVILGVLTVLALGGMRIFALRQQLTLEELNAAKTRWEAKKPHNYDMDYVQSGSAPGNFQVKVRHNQVVEALRDGQPLEARLYRFQDMLALFGFVQEFLDQDSQPNKPRTYSRAFFDPDDGHLIHFVRKELGTNNQIEINVQLTRVQENSAEPKSATGSPR